MTQRNAPPATISRSGVTNVTSRHARSAIVLSGRDCLCRSLPKRIVALRRAARSEGAVRTCLFVAFRPQAGLHKKTSNQVVRTTTNVDHRHQLAAGTSIF